MSLLKSVFNSLLKVGYAAFLGLILVHPTFGQASRIPPEYVDDWFSNRVWYMMILGAFLGLLVASVWLPRLLPMPHSNDKRRARIQFVVALVITAFVLAGLLLLDVSLNYQFGNRAYNFSETFSQVWLTRWLALLVLVGALAFVAIVALFTRASDKFYRYMLIPR